MQSDRGETIREGPGYIKRAVASYYSLIQVCRKLLLPYSSMKKRLFPVYRQMVAELLNLCFDNRQI